jgi:hypothetical protein
MLNMFIVNIYKLEIGGSGFHSELKTSPVVLGLICFLTTRFEVLIWVFLVGRNWGLHGSILAYSKKKVPGK